LHPLGWFCLEEPFYLDFDNAGNYYDPGCDSPNSFAYEYYGYDDITWFALQNSTNRDIVLRYFYYKIKSMSYYGHLAMPGRRPITGTQAWANRNSVNFYRANMGPEWPGLTGYFNQQATIFGIWNNIFGVPADWVVNNFTNENVSNGPDIGPFSDLILVGADKMFYIGNDGYVHGYIQVNNSYNSGTWLTVSPSYAAQIIYGATDASQQVINQVTASTGLVANPDGTLLLYIGVDGYIHGFNAIDEWNYYYIDFQKDSMSTASYVAYSSLIFPKEDRIYFIGALHTTSERFVLGFTKDSSGVWHFANVSNLAVEWPKVQPFGSLTYTPTASYDNIYYIGIDGYLYYLEVVSLSLYYYINPIAVNNMLISNNILLLTSWGGIPSNLAVYFNTSNLNTWIYFVACDQTDVDNNILGCITQFSTGLNFINLNTYRIPNFVMFSQYTNNGNIPYIGSGLTNGIPNSCVSVSPDGSTILFFSKADPTNLSSFYYDGLNYYYETIQNEDDYYYLNSMQFADNFNVFYIRNNAFGSSDLSNGSVQHLKKEEPFANNPCIKQWPV